METTQTEPTWPQLLGSNNWENLLDPLHLNLRKLILTCGDFCQATYDAFNNDQNSNYCGTSRYGKNKFFQKVMLENASKYKVTSFLYATARVGLPEAFILHSLSRDQWDRESNWIGYIAVTSDETSQALGRREIYVAWRGTTRSYEWVNVFEAKMQSAKPLLSTAGKESIPDEGTNSSSDSDDDGITPKVMQGWLTIYISEDPKSPYTKLSARTQFVNKIKQLKEQYQGENISITITGHSLGASLAIVSAFDLVENGVTDIPVSAIVFGSPQVGNRAFKDRFETYQNLKILHIRNKIDIITLYPGLLLGYVDIGTDIVIDTRKSPNLKDSKNPGDWHNLQAMLHVVAGWNGEENEFELRVKRSLALVNKSCEFLKDENRVPGSWWVEKNKGMVRGEDGEWSLGPEDEEDLPVPEF
ncbi:lipase family protein [Tripterygium wilfordii]|uniref:Phospholipase A1 n=1 Tax=Tripterygium wilfordii TaxID=458696 RepID=A0A7J7DCT2_TRIWF|nr:phospholipase A1-IIdelta isoform X2 [Tripterygium wilfordii]KAF5744069.1 lipase family protein [Tripterygium wilfordii]